MAGNGIPVQLVDPATGLPYSAAPGASNPIPTGTNTIGKVGIDQSTPGTSNAVQVIGSLPAGSNALGSVVLAAGSAAIGTVSLTGSLPAFASTPTFNIGTAPAIVLAAGAAAIGSVTVTSSTLPTGAATSANQAGWQSFNETAGLVAVTSGTSYGGGNRTAPSWASYFTARVYSTVAGTLNIYEFLAGETSGTVSKTIAVTANGTTEINLRVLGSIYAAVFVPSANGNAAFASGFTAN